MTELKPYPDYKDSGAQWLGRLPTSWQVVPAKSAFRERKVASRPDDVHLTPSQTYGVLPQVEYMERTGNRVVLNLTGADNMRHVEPDDFISHLRSFQGGLEHSRLAGKVSAAYTVLQPESFVVPKYFRYVFKSSLYIQALQTTTDQLRDGQSIRFAQFTLLPLPMPDKDTQSEIGDFLDRETAEIDAFIADQEELIGLLTERRAATISHAVTKGLDPSVPMKDSGIEWLRGAVAPSHWTEIKLGLLVRLKSGKAITSESIEAEGEYPVFGGGGFRGYTDYYTNDGHFVLIGRQGALCGNVKVASGKFFASEHALVAYPQTTLDTDWLGALLEVMDLGQYSQSAAQPGLSAEVLGQKKTILPPLIEQKVIAKYIRDETQQIDAAIADAREAITLSRERRAALISAAVTGKIDVRSAA